MGIKLSAVSYSYNYSRKTVRKGTVVYALTDIDLSIAERGEFMAIAGHTGSGKSTLVQMLNVLLQPVAGTVEIDTVPVTKRTKLKPLRKKTGLVFQFPEYQIFEETCLKDIMFGPKNFGLDEPEARAQKVAELLGIGELLERAPFTLSGGQMRKVAIAGILASDPEILVLDEPTAGLDPQAKQELLALLTKINTEIGTSIIIITHDMDVVAQWCRRVVVLSGGKKAFDGTPQALFADEALLAACHLELPSTVKILKALKTKLGLAIDPYALTLEAAVKVLAEAADEQ